MTTPDEEITGYGGQAGTGTPQKAASSGQSSSSSSGNGVAPMSGSGVSQGATSEDIKAKAAEAGEQLKNQGKAQLDSYRGTAADELEKVAQSAKAAAAELEIRTAPACPTTCPTLLRAWSTWPTTCAARASTSWSAR